LEPDRLLLSEMLRERGYQTAAVVSSFVLNHQFGYQQGFSFYDDDFRGADTSYQGVTSWEGHEVRGGFDRRANETTDRAIAWLDTHANRGPFFLWVHYFDPHHPYDPPAEYRRKYETTGTEDLAWARSLYDAEVEFTDHEVGRFVDRLDELVAPQETLLIVTADHGEGLLDHGFMGHGPILFEETLRVPLLIRWKGRIEEGGTFADPVSLIDVAPTVLGLVGVETDKLTLQGEDLSGNLFEGKPTGDRRAMFFQRRRYQSNVVPTFDVEGVRFGGPLEVKGLKFGVRQGPWKYIEARDEATWELYNLVSDPGETTNVLDENSRVHRDLADRLMAWRKAQTELAVGDVQEIPEDVLRQLESLGYVK
jgi:arylsulfatase A-like enzyme